MIKGTNWPKEISLSHGVQSIAIDDGRLIEANIEVIEGNFAMKTPDSGRDLSDGYQLAHIKHMRSSENYYRPLRCTNRCQILCHTLFLLKYAEGMKISVSLPDDDVRFLDSYTEMKGFTSRSATLHRAIRLLRASELGSDYAAAWSEWNTEEEVLWDSTTNDGLR